MRRILANETTGHRFNITIDHATSANSSDRSTISTDEEEEEEEEEEEDGVHVSPISPRSAADSFSDPAEEHDGSSSWTNVIYPEEIQPSDSASRPRTSNQPRPPAPEVPRAEEARRPSYRRHITQERARNLPPQRAYPRAPHSETAESVDSHEEWQGYGARGPHHHISRQYYTAGYPSPLAYQTYAPPSVVPPGQQAMVPYGYPSYQPPIGGPVSSYFTHGHHPGPSHEMIPHGHPAAFYGYPPQGFPMPISPPPAMYQTFPAMYSPPLAPAPAPAPAAAPAPAPTPTPAPAPAPAPAAPAQSSTPPPAPDTSNDTDEKFARIEKLFLDQKAEQEAKEAAAQQALKDAAAKAEADKQRAEEIAAASAAAAAAAKEEVEAEYKAAAEKAKADKEAADKAAAEAAAAAAAAAPPPPPKEKDKPLKFQDAIGRKFSFPFHLCNTWSVSRPYIETTPSNPV